MPDVYNVLKGLLNDDAITKIGDQPEKPSATECLRKFKFIEENLKQLFSNDTYEKFFSTVHIQECVEKLNDTTRQDHKQSYDSLNQELEKVTNNLLGNFDRTSDKANPYNPHLTSTMPLGDLQALVKEMNDKISGLEEVPTYPDNGILKNPKVMQNSSFQNAEKILEGFYENIFRTLFSVCENFIKKDFATIKVNHSICSTVKSLYTLTSKKNMDKVIYAIATTSDKKSQDQLINFSYQYYILYTCFDTNSDLNSITPSFSKYSPEKLDTLFTKKYRAFNLTPKEFFERLSKVDDTQFKLLSKVDEQTKKFRTNLSSFMEKAKETKELFAYFILCKSYKYGSLFGHLDTKETILLKLKNSFAATQKNEKVIETYISQLDSFFYPKDELTKLLYSRYTKRLRPKYDEAKKNIINYKAELPKIQADVMIAHRGLKNQHFGELYVRNITRINLIFDDIFGFIESLAVSQDLSINVKNFLRMFGKLLKYIEHNISALKMISVSDTFPPFYPPDYTYFKRENLKQGLNIYKGILVPHRLAEFYSSKAIDYNKALMMCMSIFVQLQKSEIQQEETIKLFEKNPPSKSENIKYIFLQIILYSIFVSSVWIGYQNALAANAATLA